MEGGLAWRAELLCKPGTQRTTDASACTSSRHGPLCRIQLSQKQLDVSSLQHKASKKPRAGGGGSSSSGGAGGSADAAAAAALRRNNALPITAFFGRTPRTGQQ